EISDIGEGTDADAEGGRGRRSGRAKRNKIAASRPVLPVLPVLPVPPVLPYFPVMMKCPRRFCCQQASVSSEQKGASLPLLTTVTRVAATPRLTRYSFTLLARREPSARLYSELPRESAWPSSMICVTVHFFIQSAFACNGPRASARISDMS